MRSLFSLTLIILIAAQLTGDPVHGMPDPKTPTSCDSAWPVTVGDEAHVPGPASFGTESYAIEVPHAGRLVIEASPILNGLASYWIDFEGVSCDGAKEETAWITDLSPGRLVVAVKRAGTYITRIGATHDHAHIGSVRLRAELIPVGPVDLPTKDGEPGDDTEEADNEIVPFTPPDLTIDPSTCRSLPALSSSLLSCARRIDSDDLAKSLIERPGGSYVDHLVFDLESAREVRIDSLGPDDTYASLLDAYGTALLTDDDGGADRNFALHATIGPGRYYLRVEASPIATMNPYLLRFTSEQVD